MTSYTLITLHKKYSFPLVNVNVNVTKSAGSFIEEILNEKIPV